MRLTSVEVQIIIVNLDVSRHFIVYITSIQEFTQKSPAYVK